MPGQLDHASSGEDKDAWLPPEPEIQRAVSTYVVTLRERGQLAIAAELAAVLLQVSV